MEAVRNKLIYGSGYLQGRSAGLPTSFGELYGTMMSKVTSLLTLPLPLISFLAIPLYGGSSTTVSLASFYLTWSSLVWSKGPLTIELYGTIIIKFLFYLAPAIISLGFDSVLPNVSRKIKAAGKVHLPRRLGREKILKRIAVSTGNVLLGVLSQAVLELTFTKVFHLRSLFKVTTVVPLPWTIATDLLKGFVLRGIVRYAVHRFLLHEWTSVLSRWHLQWQHSTDITFSMLAAYDHPATYLLANFLPTYLTAVCFRWHVLTWHLFVILVSLEDLCVFSGYTALPSTIILGGMARRNEAHFASAGQGGGMGNYGRRGILDLLCGTTCPDEDDVMDDIQDEVEKHNVQDRVAHAVGSGISKSDRNQPRRRK